VSGHFFALAPSDTVCLRSARAEPTLVSAAAALRRAEIDPDSPVYKEHTVHGRPVPLPPARIPGKAEWPHSCSKPASRWIAVQSELTEAIDLAMGSGPTSVRRVSLSGLMGLATIRTTKPQ